MVFKVTIAIDGMVPAQPLHYGNILESGSLWSEVQYQ